MSLNKNLKIKIFDREYSLVVDNEDRARKVSEYVNSLINDLSVDMNGQPSHTIAIVAALNIANDYFIEKETSEKDIAEATERLNRLNLLFEDISK